MCGTTDEITANFFEFLKKFLSKKFLIILINILVSLLVSILLIFFILLLLLTAKTILVLPISIKIIHNPT